MRSDQSLRDEHWRFLGLTSADGADNMAIDEALLEEAMQGPAIPMLRLYDWARPTLSIGNAQPISDIDVAACRAQGIEVVRRASGGTAVLHEDQVAYSLILPAKHRLACSDIVDSYRQISIPLLATMTIIGLNCTPIPPDQAARGASQRGFARAACFSACAPYELVYQGRKLVGNSQVRRRGTVLHHGVLPLVFDSRSLVRLLSHTSEAEREGLVRYLDGRVGSLSWATGRPVSPVEVEQAIRRGFTETLEVNLIPHRLTPKELRLARCLRQARYDNSEWTFRL